MQDNYYICSDIRNKIMKEVSQGNNYIIAENSLVEQEIIFSETKKNSNGDVLMYKEGTTETEVLSVLVSRLSHRYQEESAPDILSAIRKLKEANYLISPHLNPPVTEE